MLRRAAYHVYAFLCFGASVAAYPVEWGPFEPGTEPKRFPLAECVQVQPRVDDAEGNPIEYTFGIRGGPKPSPRVRVERKSELTYLSILSSDGTRIVGPQVVSEMFSCLDALHADLNRDGREDFIVRFPSMGCGRAGEYCTVTLAISDGKSYRMTSIMTMLPGEEDFIDVDGDGRCEIIQTAFVFNKAENERDHRPHNYHVYHLLEIKGSELLVSQKDRSFPRWIWYTFKPNHKPTQRLTSSQKTSLWKDQGMIFWRQPERTCDGDSSTTQTARP